MILLGFIIAAGVLLYIGITAFDEMLYEHDDEDEN